MQFNDVLTKRERDEIFQMHRELDLTFCKLLFNCLVFQCLLHNMLLSNKEIKSKITNTNV